MHPITIDPLTTKNGELQRTIRIGQVAKRSTLGLLVLLGGAFGYSMLTSPAYQVTALWWVPWVSLKTYGRDFTPDEVTRAIEEKRAAMINRVLRHQDDPSHC